MKLPKNLWMKTVLISMLFVSVTGTAAAAPPNVWMGPTGSGGWGNFMQVIMQQDYRLQMSNGNPYWNTLMLPVEESSLSSGISSYMGMPAFGFCPTPGQCYMVMIQRPLASGTMVCPPVPAASITGPGTPNQQGKPTSLW